MKHIFLPFFTCITLLLAGSSCRQEGAAPIRNIKAGPNLLRAQAGGACTTYTYVDNQGQRALGNVYTKQILVSFVNGLSAEDEKNTLARYGFVEKAAGQVASNSAILQNVTLTDGLNCSQVEEALQVLAKDPNIAYAAPYFLDGSRLRGISKEVIVTVEGEGMAELKQLAKQYNAEVLPSQVENEYIIRVDKHSKGNALELANLLQGNIGISRAEPDFVVTLNE
jgi:hypothetical protein